MGNKKRIAFVYGRAGLNAAKLLYMPFGLNTLKMLANTNCNIDLYLTQDPTDDYKNNLPKNVNIIFLNNKTVWNFGSGKGLYYLLNLLFYYLTFNKKYNEVWGIGQVGAVLAGKLATRKKTPFYYLSDEFPNISYLKIWSKNEKKYAGKSQIFIVPDETRLEVTIKQIPSLTKTNGFTLPNIPLIKGKDKFIEINWHEKFNLSKNLKIIMYAGGIDKENNIELLLTVFPFTNEQYILIMVGNGKNFKENFFFKHKRIIWIEQPLSDEELHSLIKQSICNICYYSNIMDLEFVGKSSGKIMRSLLMGTPVISTKFESLQFIEDDKMGLLIKQPYELVEAIEKINRNIDFYKKNINHNISKYYFETYWDKLPIKL